MKFQLTSHGLIPVPMLRSQDAFDRLYHDGREGRRLCERWNDHVRAMELRHDEMAKNEAFMRSHNAVIRAVRVVTKAREIRRHLAAWEGQHAAS